MGPALETFLQVLFLVALIAAPIALLLRKPLIRFWRKLRETDRRQLADCEAREREQKEETEARKLALLELQRDCHIEDMSKEEQAKPPVRKQ